LILANTNIYQKAFLFAEKGFFYETPPPFHGLNLRNSPDFSPGNLVVGKAFRVNRNPG